MMKIANTSHVLHSVCVLPQGILVSQVLLFPFARSLNCLRHRVHKFSTVNINRVVLVHLRLI